MFIIALLAAIFVVYLFVIMPNAKAEEKARPFVGLNIARFGLYENGTDHPENSLSAIKLAILGEFGIFLPVRMTADGILVVLADENLLRMTGVDRNVSETDWADLCRLELLLSHERILALEEALLTIDGKVPLMLSIETDNRPLETAHTVMELLARYQGSVAVISSQRLILERFKNTAPKIPRGVRVGISGSFWEGFFNRFLLTNRWTRPDLILQPHKSGRSFPLLLCKSFFRVVTVGYTIRSMDEYRSVNRIFDGLIFENITPSARFLRGKVTSSMLNPTVVARSADQYDETKRQ